MPAGTDRHVRSPDGFQDYLVIVLTPSFRTRSQAARRDLPAEVPPPVLERAGATACVAADELFSARIIQRRDPAALCLGRPVVSPVVRARGP